MLKALTAELRKPHGQKGTVAAVSINLFPAYAGVAAKNIKFDHCIPIGTEDSKRSWLQGMALLLLRQRNPANPLLFQVEHSLYARLFEQAGTTIGLPKATPYQLRHGGASADAIAKVGEVAIAERENWASMQSVQRYRAEGRYVRALRRLSHSQLTQATRLNKDLASRFRNIL